MHIFKEKKAYFDLCRKEAVLLTEDELIENGFNHYTSLGKWDKFLYENEDIIAQNVVCNDSDFANIHYTIKSNTGTMSCNTYNTLGEAFTAAAVNLYIERRGKDGNI